MTEFQDEPTPTLQLEREADIRFHPATRTYHEAATPPVLRPQAPTAARIYEMIMLAAERQIATAAVARPIIEAGVEDALHALMAQIAANAANPIADLLEDALADCAPDDR